jgi:glutaredoxin
MHCPVCGHIRTRLDPLPETHCPGCGSHYAESQRQVELGVHPAIQTSRGRSGPDFKRGAFLLAPLALVAAVWFWILTPVSAPEPTRPTNPSAPMGSISAAPTAQPHVVMYATTWCPYCAKARAFFRRNGIQYTEYDIERDPRANAAYRRLGGGGVPIVVVGDDTVRGYDEPRLRSLLRASLGWRADSTPAYRTRAERRFGVGLRRPS